LRERVLAALVDETRGMIRAAGARLQESVTR
jgi:hypothetical protein